LREGLSPFFHPDLKITRFGQFSHFHEAAHFRVGLLRSRFQDHAVNNSSGSVSFIPETSRSLKRPRACKQGIRRLPEEIAG